MARRNGINIPLRNYSGTDTFGPIDLLPDEKSFVIELQRCTTVQPTIWPSADTFINIICEMSADGGATWEASGSTTDCGGIQLDRLGEEVPLGEFSTSLRPAPVRQFRVTINITNGPLRTSGVVGLFT